jgi:hypothetical protein
MALANVMVDKGRSGEAGHLPCALPPFLGEVGSGGYWLNILNGIILYLMISCYLIDDLDWGFFFGSCLSFRK